jgi:hypothetical protein
MDDETLIRFVTKFVFDVDYNPGSFTKIGETIYPNWNPVRNFLQTRILIDKIITKGYNVTIGFKRNFCFADIKRESYPVPMDSFYAEDKIPGRALCLAVLRMFGVE